MNRDVARGIAAKAWNHPNCRRRVMDPNLLNEFAEILADEVQKAQLEPREITIADAKYFFKKSFNDDFLFKNAYRDAISKVILSDQTGDAPANLQTRADCNVLADQLMKRIFES
jgi:hypothetical protein